MEVVQYKCPSCGANLEFNIEKQAFTCAYCDSEFTKAQIEEIYPEQEEAELDTQEPEKTEEEKRLEEDFGVHNVLYSCPSCGAEVVTDDITSATFCHYCQSPVILTGRLGGEYRPSKVLPFMKTEADCKDVFNNWCGKRWFVPKDFKSPKNLDKLQGIYIPFWLADCNTNGNIVAQCKKIRSWSSGSYRYTNTKEYIAARAGSMIFNGIPADGSKKADDTLMEAIEPYNYDQLVDFSMSYLSGHTAERYDIGKDEIYPRIEGRAKQSVIDTFRSSINGYSSVNVTYSKININKIYWQHILLPVWFLSYNYKGKKYEFAMNGQTGKFSGTLPINWTKAGLFIAGIGVLTLVLCMLGGALL